MRSLLLVFAYFAILYLGTQSSFILVLGYVWVDIFTPQLLAYSVLPSIPVSLIMGACVFVALIFLKPVTYVKVRPATILTAIFAVWMTISLIWAVAPGAAVQKWDWAIKNLAFSCMIPFFFRNRIQIEAFIWTIVISGIAHCLPFAAKFLISGGGYGFKLSLVGNNTGFGESSTLSLFSICLVPLCLYLYRWQTIVPYTRIVRVMLIGFVFAAILTALGTYARTGLISIAVLGWLLLVKSKQNKVLVLFVVTMMGLIAYYNTSDAWLLRMSTIGDGEDESAMGRVAVWSWTIKYVLQHPLGGSFEMYRINQYALFLENGRQLIVAGKAFHSIYFEVLGEGGWVGFAIFSAIIFKTRQAFSKIAKAKYATKEMAWLPELARLLLMSFYIYLAGGLFVGIAFQPYLYYLVALSVVVLNMALKTQKDN